MNSMNFSLLLVALAFGLIQPMVCSAQDQPPGWKDSNNKGIEAMRAGDFAESERLFQKALSECSTADGKATIQDNLNVLLIKEGKRQDGNVQVNANNSSGSAGDSMSFGSASNDQSKPDIHRVIAELDAQIKNADNIGNLELLQNLFKKRAQALVARDGCETLDYAYCLHYRAQVLEELHRNDEADQLEVQAKNLRDALRRLAASGPAQAPTKTKSTLSSMSYAPLPPPDTRPIQPVQETYASSTPINRRAPHSWRNFANAGATDTSGFLNGNPNAPVNGW